ncbi:MAG TPA: type II toxin-antitoxin system antitoxin SocA domain-containing protein [Nostocaceae cyanobacterium]|nr:type II toxin-antitoxin system antitoxin SocA domain-containing protein [Nostocaceae cyanobacterium]
MTNCLDIAKYFIIRAYEDGVEAEMTNMKVQKLLYYAQSLHLAMYDEPLFENEIQAWRYGPVCPPAYRFYSEFEAKQLPIPNKDVLSLIPDDKKQLLEEVWQNFGVYHAYTLSGMTHVEFPWKKARKGLPPEASSTEPIPVEDLKALGHEKLDWIERENPAYQIVMSEILKDVCTSKAKRRIHNKGEIRDWFNSFLD